MTQLLKVDIAMQDLVRAAIDCDFAARLSFEERFRQLMVVAWEICQSKKISYNEFSCAREMRILAAELEAHLPQAA